MLISWVICCICVSAIFVLLLLVVVSRSICSAIASIWVGSFFGTRCVTTSMLIMMLWSGMVRMCSCVTVMIFIVCISLMPVVMRCLGWFGVFLISCYMVVRRSGRIFLRGGCRPCFTCGLAGMISTVARFDGCVIVLCMGTVWWCAGWRGCCFGS